MNIDIESQVFVPVSLWLLVFLGIKHFPGLKLGFPQGGLFPIRTSRVTFLLQIFCKKFKDELEILLANFQSEQRSKAPLRPNMKVGVLKKSA